jgi:hypothetical protein
MTADRLQGCNHACSLLEENPAHVSLALKDLRRQRPN